MVLEALQAGIIRQLAVLDDVGLTGTGQSSADVLGVPGTVLAEKLAGYLVREIVVRGSRGGPLFPLASQLNDDVTHLQGQQIQGTLRELGSLILETLARLGTGLTASAPTPAQLPPSVPEFTGREGELGLLAELLDPKKAPGPVVVSAVAGLAGVGKTSLAVQAGHAALRRGWFGGGVLFIDMHGYDDRRIDAAQALEVLLRALTVPAFGGDRYPAAAVGPAPRMRHCQRSLAPIDLFEPASCDTGLFAPRRWAECALKFDYAARQKFAGTSLKYYLVKQLPALPPEAYRAPTPWLSSAADWIRQRVLELSFTAWDMQEFARDLGDDGPPFRWDVERRTYIRAELDAAYFHLYGLERDEVEHVMESFDALRRREEKPQNFGEFRTKRLILERYDALAEAVHTGEPYQTILDPLPGYGPRHPARTHAMTEGHGHA